MKLIIGLGNPGDKYKNTRHNLGQNIIFKLIENQKLILKNYSKLSAQLTKCKGRPMGLPNNEIIIGITTDYMNNSGLTVKKIIDYFKINPKDLYVIHDDLDLRVGEYKIQFDRGAAGHNGVKSIIENIGTQAFNRIRVGVDHPQNNIPIEDYVLLPFTKEEKDIIDSTIPKIIEDINNIIRN